MTAPTPIVRPNAFCSHGGAVLSRCAGNNAIGMWCDDCRSWVTKHLFGRAWLAKDHSALQGVVLEAIPTVGERTYRKCEGPCGQLAICQFHHIAPRKFFGDACDDWPTFWLCVACHAEWHSRVTPGLCTAYDPDAHATQLLGYLTLDFVARLCKSLLKLGSAKRAGAA